MILPTPHWDKLNAALTNPKCSKQDRKLLELAKEKYASWMSALGALTTTGKKRVEKMVELLNQYKDDLEVEIVGKSGSEFLKRQKGQLKLDNSVLEEFLPHLLCQEIIPGLIHTRFEAGPQKALMSLSFTPHSFEHLGQRPQVALKRKDQDFALGSTVHYSFSASADFHKDDTVTGHFFLAVLAAECKVNLDKTMFQEACGTATRLKQGCPVAKYFVLVEYLDMTPEDTRLTDVDNVYLLRKTRRLPVGKRQDVDEIEKQHKESPICADVVWLFATEIQNFVNAIWYDPAAALDRGAFV